MAPNLVERVKTLTPRAFATKVLTSYRIVLPANEADTEDRTAKRDARSRRSCVGRGARGQVIMPRWEADPKVNPHARPCEKTKVSAIRLHVLLLEDGPNRSELRFGIVLMNLADNLSRDKLCRPVRHREHGTNHGLVVRRSKTFVVGREGSQHAFV